MSDTVNTVTGNRRPLVLIIWWRTLITIGAIAAALASFFYLRDLALMVGWTDIRALAVPVSLDALAAAALTRWVLTRDPVAAAVSATLVLASATGNALSHLYGTGHWQPTAPVIVGVGVVPVVAFFVIAHLMARSRRDQWLTSSLPETVAETAQLDRPAASIPVTGIGAASSAAASGSGTATSRSTSNGGRARTASAPGTGATSATRRSVDDLSRTILANGWLDLTWDELASKQRLSCAKGRAGKALEQARRQAALSDGNGKVATGTSG